MVCNLIEPWRVVGISSSPYLDYKEYPSKPIIMKSIRTLSWKTLQNSLLLRMGGAIVAIALLAVLGMTVSGLVAESTQGSGEAINRAGSLRLQSWQMASMYLAAPLPAGGGSGARMTEAMRSFEATLESPAIQAMLPRTPNIEPALTYHQIRSEWLEHIRPRFQTLADGCPASQDASARAALLAEIGQFVDRINHLVKRLEETTEAKILVMRLVLGVALILTVLVVMLTIHFIYTQFVQPLRGLLTLASRVGQGDLSVSTPHTGPDELGQLGCAFNLMAEDLYKVYQNLEERVEQKTAELTRSNQSLELLYHSISRLHGAPPDRETWLALLRDIEVLLDLGHGLICLGEYGGDSGQVIASTLTKDEPHSCDTANCLWCHGTNQTRVSIACDYRRHLTLPLADTEHQYGVLIFIIPAERQIEPWQVQLLEALSRHIGVAIGAEQQINKNRRLDLLEERAVIARELHDSLAQSLAYMKIQVSRMKNILRNQSAPGQMENILEELREGLDSAYRQLRELLSSFRMKIEEGTLAQALSRTASEFSDRSGLPIELNVDIGGCQLSPNEEIHVLHIVREALSNVMHHAQATGIQIHLHHQESGEITMTVEDDGVGITRAAEVHHYGMTIMEERARTLHGRIDFHSQSSVGTCVTLTFTPSDTRNLKN